MTSKTRAAKPRPRASVAANHMPTHQALLGLCLDYLRAQGAWSYKVWGGPFARPGLPDVLATLLGRTVALEIKTGSGRLTKTQQDERDDLVRAGALYVLARSVDDLEAALLDARLISAPILRAPKIPKTVKTAKTPKTL